jgi:uncharacterized protein YbcI
MPSSLPTRGQLERTLSQQIEALYANELGHRPAKVTCHIFGEQITVVLEEAITQPEQLLTNSGQEELAEQVRNDLDKALQPKLTGLIETVTGIRVTDLLSDAKLETGRKGIIAILEGSPQFRESTNKTQIKKQQTTVNSRTADS